MSTVAERRARARSRQGVEEWRAVVGWEGLYEISNLGRVRSLTRTTPCGRWGQQTWHGAIRAPGGSVNGYLGVGVSGGGRRARIHIHVAVLVAFVGPRPPGAEARHLNGVRTDNRLANLAWGTKFENASDRERHGKQVHGESSPNAKLKERDVCDIHAMLGAGMSLGDIARSFNVSKGTVARIRRRETWSHVERR